MGKPQGKRKKPGTHMKRLSKGTDNTTIYQISYQKCCLAKISTLGKPEIGKPDALITLVALEI